MLGEDVEPDSRNRFVCKKRERDNGESGSEMRPSAAFFVPDGKLEAAAKAISDSLAQTTIGSPLNEKVRMGSLAGQDQRREVKEQVQNCWRLLQLVYGSLDGAGTGLMPTTASEHFFPLAAAERETFFRDRNARY